VLHYIYSKIYIYHDQISNFSMQILVQIRLNKLVLSYVKCSFDHDLVTVVFPWTVRIVNVCSDHHTTQYRLPICVTVIEIPHYI